MDPDVLRAVLDLRPEIEASVDAEGEPRYRLRFTSLGTTDQAHRVLLERGEPLHVSEIAAEINRRRSAAGTRSIRPRTLAARLSDDPRFEPMGRGGRWRVATG